MDLYKAKQIEQTLAGKDFHTYRIVELINHGKSAAVFKATDSSGSHVAVKIFDNDLIERFGHEIQEKRIRQEIGLKGHSIQNLVKILDGGSTQIDGQNYYFIVMEFIRGQNLKQYIGSATYDNSFLQKFVKTAIDVTENLLKNGIVHRDIKPENIMIDESGEIKLMDLGVLKLIGVKSFSDIEERQFVGTLRYAPPEFLTRSEEDSHTGWRAVNLYQIGGVLHDLIMKTELFSEATPYTNLVLAIKDDTPKISQPTFPFKTIQLARDLMIKDWRTRLATCTNERIQSFCVFDANSVSNLDMEIDNILALTSDNRAQFEEIEKINRSNQEKQARRVQISKTLELSISECLKRIESKGIFEKFEKTQAFSLDKQPLLSHSITKNVLFKIESTISKGFPKPFFLLVSMSSDENSLCKISIVGIFHSSFVRIDMKEPLKTLRLVLAQMNNGQSTLVTSNTLKMLEIFNGTVGFDDQFKNHITLEIAKLIKVALSDVQGYVKAELQTKEDIAKGTRSRVQKQNLNETRIYNKI